MPIRVALHHKTTYHYDRLVKLSPQVIRLRPAPHCRTKIHAYSLKVEPGEHFLNWQQDPHSNFLARAVFPEKTRHFSVTVDLVAEMAVINPFDFFLEEHAEEFPFPYEPALAQDLAPFLRVGQPGPKLAEYLGKIDRRKRRTMDFLVDVNQMLQNDIRYLIRMEPGVQTSEQTLTSGSGSCRDSAWLLVEMLRNLGLAARFVSGYLIQLKPDVKALDGPSGAAEDFTDLHAWTEVYLPGAGWVGMDPTSGLLAGEGHIPLAATPEASSAAPISGAVEQCEVRFAHEMSVERVHEDPRVTLPYTDQQWEEIQELGEKIDRDLEAGDVQLTMGGEPTFISIDNMDAPEWNSAALGKEKRKLAERLIERLRRKFAEGGLLHFGQGKWYPGEPLPRWALACYWRADGIPLWHDHTLFAREGEEHNYTHEDADRFARLLSQRLGVDPEYASPVYEDPMHYIQRERQLPVNVDPSDSKLEDAQERDRIRRVFERGLGNPAGMVLPLQRAWGENGPEWQTGLWMLRAKRPPVYLIPGDSPAGLRLPLASLPWAAQEERPQFYPPDPMADLAPLPMPQRYEPTSEPVMEQPEGLERDQVPALGKSGKAVVRTALCMEAREGRMHVFMPPLSKTEDYAELLTAIEDTASELKMSIVLEGYPPPTDPRMLNLKVTPDPGVIEVNVHPAKNWQELVHNTEIYYEEARQSRLTTEKFMIDGKHTGTGGGNHFVLGSETPKHSPFLRRPDLLRSMVGYWLNHPALSYAFSTIFIGPTSQAPRVDETRADNLYELEIAFSLVPEPDFDRSPDGNPACPPWLTDRIFRHLLVDLTGNTHRAEFCIDKLYSPDSSSGRLGLLELRGFEMPPHARMSLTQQLLVRGLIAWFWKTPYRHKPIHWRTRLHDEFMLPHYIGRDLQHVLDDLNQAGYPFHPEWFSAHFEFRYPVMGRVVYDGIEIELRQATEPWYVLGEESTGSGTARYVDSSVERLQVKVRGMTGDRYMVTCNGRRVPLHETGTNGEWVAGVRFRAWQPPSCLHPTIPVHAPLVFDLLDTWTGRSVGGCTYHVSHPGGRSHETLPVNANEAEGRRSARFEASGHTAGPVKIPPVEENPEFPMTLDLRRPGPRQGEPKVGA